MRKYIVAAIPLMLLVSAIVQIACSGGGSQLTQPEQKFDASYPPRNLTWDTGSERIFLSWDTVPFAAGYHVYISPDGVNFNRYSGNILVSKNSIVITDLVNGNAYFVGVSAVGTSGKETAITYPGGLPNAQPITPDSLITDEFIGVPPAPPRNLFGFAGDRSVHIEWDPNTEPDLDYYNVYVRAETMTVGIYSIYVLTKIRDTFYDWNDLTNGLRYDYKVTAVDIEEPPLESGFSNEVHFTPISAPPLAPENFRAVWVLVDGVVRLDWKLPIEQDIVKYRIMRFDWTDGEVHPIEDTLVVTVNYPEAFPGEIIPPVDDPFIIREHVYEYILFAIDSDGQLGAGAVADPDRLTIPL